MRVAGGEVAIGCREVGSFLDRQPEFGHRPGEAPDEKVGSADRGTNRSDAPPRTETQRDLGVLNSDIWLACPKPKPSANVPPTGKARVGRQCLLQPRSHCSDVFAK